LTPPAVAFARDVQLFCIEAVNFAYHTILFRPDRARNEILVFYDNVCQSSYPLSDHGALNQCLRAFAARCQGLRLVTFTEKAGPDGTNWTLCVSSYMDPRLFSYALSPIVADVKHALREAAEKGPAG
jgi:hypothetical protein